MGYFDGDDTFYFGNDELVDEDDDNYNYWKSELIDTYGMDEDDLEDLDEVDCEELYDKLSGSSSYKSTRNYASQHFTTSSTPPTTNSVADPQKSCGPSQKRWSVGTCIGIGFIVSFYCCTIVDGNMSSILACVIIVVVAVIAYLLKGIE